MNWQIGDVGNVVRARECVYGVEGWVRFEPCVLPKMSISSSVHMSGVNMFVYNVHVSSSNCYCAHKCATQQ